MLNEFSWNFMQDYVKLYQFPSKSDNFDFVICTCACVCEHMSIQIPALNVWTVLIVFICSAFARMLGDRRSCVVPDL